MEEGEEGSVVAVVVAAAAAVVVVIKAGWKTLSSRTGASRSCCKPSCCRLLRMRLRRGMETRAKAETRRGGSGERVSGRLGVVAAVGVGVEGPAALGGRRSLPRAVSSSFSSAPPTPPVFLNFFFSFLVAETNSCLIIWEGGVREGCGGVVAPSGEAMSSPSTLLVRI